MLKLQHECNVDLHLQQAENADLIEDELQTELITKLCTHELLQWHALLIAAPVGASIATTPSVVTGGRTSTTTRSASTTALASLPSATARLSILASPLKKALDLKPSSSSEKDST